MTKTFIQTSAFIFGLGLAACYADPSPDENCAKCYCKYGSSLVDKQVRVNGGVSGSLSNCINACQNGATQSNQVLRTDTCQIYRGTSIYMCALDVASGTYSRCP